jgi:hypothetical protein
MVLKAFTTPSPLPNADLWSLKGIFFSLECTVCAPPPSHFLTPRASTQCSQPVSSLSVYNDARALQIFACLHSAPHLLKGAQP